MAYEEKRRGRLADNIEKKFKERAAWERADTGRMSGGSGNNQSSYDHWTDEELIDRHLEEESQRRAYEHDRR
jgi:hypothetical protein